MPATNKTENFNLPLYVASDHFSVLGDFNSAMKEIDKGLGGATVTAKAASRDATSALTTANSASDDAHGAREAAQSTLSVSSQAKADATRAFDMATKATTASETANTSAIEANKVASSAAARAKEARDRADAALDTANAANTASIDAKTTANAISGQAVQATQAANRVGALHKRFKEVTAGSGDRTLSTPEERPVTVMEFDLDFDADDVWIIVAIMRHTVHNVQDTHFDIRVTGPKGQRRWSSFVAGYGPWPEAMVYSQGTGIFESFEGPGRYHIETVFLTDKNHSTRFDLSNCMMRAH